MAEKIYKFSAEYNRDPVESVFPAEEAEIEWIIGKDIYFGEIQGKHSEVIMTMKRSHFTVLTDDPIKVDIIKEIVGATGHCPFDYLDEEQGKEWDNLVGE